MPSRPTMKSRQAPAPQQASLKDQAFSKANSLFHSARWYEKRGQKDTAKLLYDLSHQLEEKASDDKLSRELFDKLCNKASAAMQEATRAMAARKKARGERRDPTPKLPKPPETPVTQEQIEKTKRFVESLLRKTR